jgi:hypothetical protein
LNSGGASDGKGVEGVRKQDDSSGPQWRPLAPTLIGGLIAGILVAATLSPPSFSTEGADLASVAGSQIDAATATMNLDAAKDAVADAKSCRVPLAEITLAAVSATTSTVRVRSGSYVSPPFALTDRPQRIAIPYPAAYPTGRGTLSVEGHASNLAVALTPTWNVNSLTGTAVRNVIWTPKAGC